MNLKLSEEEKTRASSLFIELIEIFRKLRDPQGGCPWDLKQTHQSLKQYLIEESYEAIDAIDASESNPQGLVEELGDVLLQVMLHSQIASESGRFGIEDIIATLSNKMIVRHPHVFGELKVSGTEEVLSNWEKIKQSEKKVNTEYLSGIPNALPALQQAHRIGEKVARVGFDWNSVDEVKEKVVEELNEFLAEFKENSDRAKSEFGDLLFSLAQLSRKMGFSAEEALADGNKKFRGRFREIERLLGDDLSNSSREQLEEAWKTAKKLEQKS